MKMGTLLATQRLLLINWILAPGLAIWVWIRCGFLSAGLFLVIWLIADRVWDWLTGRLIVVATRIVASEWEAFQFQMSISDKVPKLVAFMMIIDLLGTLVLPWITAGFFLRWL
jgi:hypothetical protein